MNTGIRQSAIAGDGLFAESPLAAGTVAWRFDAAPSTVDALGPVNHSCDPSTGWADDRTLVALRDLDAGTELTVDYGTCIDDASLMLRCHCETYRCRQLIEGDDWAIPQLQARYAGLFAPRLAARLP